MWLFLFKIPEWLEIQIWVIPLPHLFGFKNNIGDQELKVLGTGLGGANFITINPNVENIFNMRVSE